MLKTLKKLFEGGAGHPPHLEIRNLEVAIACLLHESKRVDLGEDVKEHVAAKAALAEMIGASEAESEKLLEEGREKARHLTSYYGPVAVIKRDLAMEQRVLLVEHLWRVAYADGRLDRDEDHYVRKIAHLLHVSNTQSMLARARARGAEHR